VIVSSEERAGLAALVADRNRPRKHVERAHIVLYLADRLTAAEVARRAGVSRPAVWRWQRRFAEAGVEGLLRDKTRRPGTAPLPQATVARVLAATCAKPLGAATHWTGRAMAKAMGIGLGSVQRIWAAHRLQPHRLRTFKRSTDPAFAEKVEDIVGLYIRPLHGAPGPCRGAVDRREVADPGSRPHPARPAAQARQMRDPDARLQTQRHHHAVRRARYPERRRPRALHDAASPSRIYPLPQCQQDAPCRPARSSMPSSTITPPTSIQGGAWLANHPRWVFHFTPTSASWLNAVEGFFSTITRRRIRRGVFKSVPDLERAIAGYIREAQQDRKPLRLDQTRRRHPRQAQPFACACRMNQCTSDDRDAGRLLEPAFQPERVFYRRATDMGTYARLASPCACRHPPRNALL